MTFHLRFLAAVFTFVGVTAEAQGIPPDPSWGISIGPITKEYRSNGKWESEDRPVYLAAIGENCTKIAVETVVFSGWMWAVKSDLDSGATAAFRILQHLTENPEFRPPCDQINLVNRLVNEDTGQELYFQNSGQEPIDAATFAALTTPDTPAPEPVTPSPDWGVHVGEMLNSYFDKQGKTRTSPIPTWIATYGDGCAELIVETLLLGSDIRESATQAPTGTAAIAITDAAADRPDLLTPCHSARIATRAIWQDSGETFVFYDDDVISEDDLTALIATHGQSSAPPAYRALASLPSGIDVYWQRYYKGLYGSRSTWVGDRTRGDRTVALHAYHGLTRAYSSAVDANETCRTQEDKNWTITRTRQDGQTGETDELGRYAIYAPAGHRAMIDRAFVGRPSGLTANWIEDGRKIVALFGCQSDEVRVLRENLRRYVEFEDPLSGDEVEALLSPS